MAEVTWTDGALHELVAIKAYIAVIDPAAAARMIERPTALGNSLAAFSDRDRPAAYDTRELTTVPPYVLNYEGVNGQVTILRVRHDRRAARD